MLLLKLQCSPNLGYDEYMKKFSIFIFFLFAFFCLATRSVFAAITISAPDTADNGKTVAVSVAMDLATWQANGPEFQVLNESGQEILCIILGASSSFNIPTPTTGSTVTLQVVNGGTHRNGDTACSHPASPTVLQAKTIRLANAITATPICTLTRNKNGPSGDLIYAKVANWDCTSTAFLSLISPKGDNANPLVQKAESLSAECTNATLQHSFNFVLVTRAGVGEDQGVTRGDYKLDVRKNSYTDPTTITSCSYNNTTDDPATVRSMTAPTLAPTLAPAPPPCGKDARSADGTCKSFDTAFGNIDTDPLKFIQRIYGILLGLSGGIIIVLIMYSGYQLMTSAGDKEKVQAARDRITSAIVGLLFLIFSMVILQVIGVDILNLPGFGG